MLEKLCGAYCLPGSLASSCFSSLFIIKKFLWENCEHVPYLFAASPLHLDQVLHSFDSTKKRHMFEIKKGTNDKHSMFPGKPFIT